MKGERERREGIAGKGKRDDGLKGEKWMFWEGEEVSRLEKGEEKNWMEKLSVERGRRR